MKIVVLAAGDQISDPSRGGYPLFLSEVEGSLLIERLIDSYKALDPRAFIVFVRQQDVVAHHIDDILQLIAPGCVVVPIRKPTLGAACTALLAIDHIDAEEELVVTNATDYLDASLSDIVASFRERQADAGTVIFDSLHPRYSFVRLDDEGCVIEAAEKRPISRHAVAGMFWFARGGAFIAALKAMIAKDVQVNGQYYICPALNEFLLDGKRICTWRVPPQSYHPFKSLQHVNTFESMLEHMRAINAAQSA